jgi:sugar phosphate isomerase/epimerase
MPGKRQVALSTMWGIGRFEHMADFASRAQELGFSHIELNYQVTGDMLEELVEGSPLPISSVHCPCPGRQLPDGRWTYRLRLSSEDEEERSLALQGALETVDTAVRVGAGLIVVHVGSVPLDEGLEPRLREMHKNGAGQAPEYQELRELLLAQREARRGPYLDASFQSLRQIVDYATDRGVKVGLESRFYFHEIPNLQEAAWLLEEFGDGVGYWHDVGHAENLARLGFTPHEEWLRTLGSRMVGIHLHDIDQLTDHKAPGLGSLDLAAIAPYVPDAALRVCELNNGNSEEEVKSGLALLEEAGLV